MGSELEARHVEKSYLLQILIAQHESDCPGAFKKLLVWAKAKMEPEDVKFVLHEFEELTHD